MPNQIMRIRRYPLAMMRRDEVTLFKCLNYLDGKCRNVYLVDSNGIFTGYAIGKREVAAGWTLDDGIPAWKGIAVRIGIVPEKVVKEYPNEKQVEYLRECLNKFAFQEEFPVLDARGKILYVIEKQRKEYSFEWQKITVPDVIRECDCVYLSSLGSDNLLGFFQRFSSEISIEVLSEKNLKDAVCNGTIVFESDGLPECRKINLIEAVLRHEKMLQDAVKRKAEEERKKKEETDRQQREEENRKREREIKKLLPMIHIGSKWASIIESELDDLSKIIEKFDEGYHTVSVVDEAGNFQRVINQYEFKDDFPRKNYRANTNLYVKYEADEALLKHNLAEAFLNTPRKEIPILKSGKIEAIGRLTDYFDAYGCWDAKRVFRFSWDWIDEAVAKEFFVTRRKILISSDCGYLNGFRETFSDWLNITVYDDSILGECLAGNFDMMIFESDCYQVFPMEKWKAYRLYYMLLVETVRRWLNQRGVEFYFFSSKPSNVPHIEQKLDRQGEILGGNLGFLREGEKPYFVCDGNAMDAVLKEKDRQPNFHSGRRCVTEAKQKCGNGIYFFGPCTAAGFASYSPDKNIESFLQKKINNENLNYYVVNCGTEGFFETDCINVNWLFRLMDTPLSLGDIVVVIGNSDYYWSKDERFKPHNLYTMITPFLSKDNEKKKCFAEPLLGHMNVTGCEVETEYMYKILSKQLRRKNFPKIRKSFFYFHPSELKKRYYLEQWLNCLPIVSENVNVDNGAIVMCADPLTKGHVYMIEEALKRCEFLYLFLLDNEKSSFKSIDERKNILSEYIKGKPISVISAGKSLRQSIVWNMPLFRFVTSVEKAFDPIYDTYTFARYVVPRLHISKYFAGEELFDKFKYRYNILKQEILMEEGVEYIEIPRKKLEDGRDIITSEIRKIWQNDGWEACRDYLPEIEVRYLKQKQI